LVARSVTVLTNVVLFDADATAEEKKSEPVQPPIEIDGLTPCYVHEIMSIANKLLGTYVFLSLLNEFRKSSEA